MSDYTRTHEVVNLDELSLANENDSHFIFYCPFCLDKRGKPDSAGKLYFSKTKLQGLCFKCNTAIFPYIDEDKEGGIDSKFKAILESSTSKFNPKVSTDPSPMQFDFKDLEIKDLEYLKSRHMFLPVLASKLGFKSWNGAKRGIVIPYFYKNYIATFQVRFDTTEKKSRYYIPKGSEKVLYSPQGIFKNFKLCESPTITICEGAFSSIAARIIGYPNPIAVQGSSLNENQVTALRKLLPENAFILMDSFDISKATQKELRKVPSISGTKIISFGENVDPEDYLKKQLKNPDKVKEYSKNVIEMLKEN